MRHITAVNYRHPTLPTAYVQVEGCTRQAALWNAKKVCTALRERLPDTAIVNAPRILTRTHGRCVFEIPVIIGECVDEAKAILAEMVLKGAA